MLSILREAFVSLTLIYSTASTYFNSILESANGPQKPSGPVFCSPLRQCFHPVVVQLLTLTHPSPEMGGSGLPETASFLFKPLSPFFLT